MPKSFHRRVATGEYNESNGGYLPIRVLDASSHGKQADIFEGILYAVRNGAHAINFSIGGDGDNAQMRSAFQAARDAGVPINVAAGNEARARSNS